ncbi:MAG: hypothetical protein PHZ04_01580 [Patescibacteria group bacterium]|nr:hypothetical protein [Patescibacteria group bacterium]
MNPTITVSPKASISPASGKKVNLSNGSVTYKVIAENGKVKRDWTVTVNTAPNTATEITGFSFPGMEKWSTQPDGNTVTINAVAQYGTDINDLAPIFEISEGATVEPGRNTKHDFSKPVVYTVTAEDRETAQEWTVKVSLAEPSKKIEITEVILGGKSADIDTTKHTVRVQVADDIKLDSVALSKLEGNFGKIEPGLKPGDKLDFTKGAKTYVFSPEDTKVKAAEKWTFIAYHPVAEADSADVAIGKGEGVEHALIRQIKENPVYWGYTGALTDSASVKKWVGNEAHKLAILTGYVGSKADSSKAGWEVRVAKVGTVYELGKDNDGKTVIKEYPDFKSYKDSNIEPIETNVAAPSLKDAVFASVDKDVAGPHVQGYEYIFTPSTCAPPCSPKIIPVSFNDLPDMPIFPADE